MNNLACQLQPDDYQTLSQLRDDVRGEVQHLLDIFAGALNATNRKKYFHEVAENRRGFTCKSLIRKFYAWMNAGCDWHVLIDKAREQSGSIELPEEFVEHWKGLCERNQRKCRPAYVKLCHAWRTGESIPGYGTWREWFRKEYDAMPPDVCSAPIIPKGWSYRNLMRFRPSKVELKAARIGRSAARSLAPLVFTTRVGSAVGKFIVFDDLEHDNKVNFLGVNRAAMTPLELAAMDLFSGSKFAYGVKPMMENDEGVKQKIKGREMRFLLASVLTQTGYRQDGTTLLVEYATAAIQTEVEKFLYDCTGGAITVQRGGIEKAAAFAGMYGSRGKGNFRLKAALESSHNLAHNLLADLPGQKGANARLNGPEEMHGRERHNDALLNAMVALPPERAALLKLPFLNFHEFTKILAQIYDLIDMRTEHDLEGWEEAGLIAHEFRLAETHPWNSVQAILALPPAQRQAADAILSMPGLTRTRKLSPREVFNQGKDKLVKLPTYCVPGILGDDLAVERKLGDNGLFEFEDRELCTDELRYLGKVTRPDGREEYLKDDETYLTFVNPFDLSQLFVVGSKKQFIGVCPRWEKVSRADTDALHRAMGAAAKQLAERLAPVAKRGKEITMRRLADTQHNLNVLEGKPITAEEKAAAKEERDRLKKEKGTMDDLLLPASIPMPSEPPAQADDGLDSLL